MVRPSKRKSQQPYKPERGKRSRSKALGAGDYRALAQFRYRLRLFLAFSDMKAKDAGVTSQQYQALLAIKGFSDKDPMHLGELSRLLLTKHHTTVELVDRLAKLGVLERTIDTRDKRRVLVTLTKRGELLLKKVATVHFEHLGSSSRTLQRISKLLASG